MTGVLDLPVDILHLILPHLDPLSFLSFTSTCRALHSPPFIYDPAYWSSRVRRDFRVPNQPVVAHDGRRWQNLYRRLLCDTRPYTWGNNEKACLGHAPPPGFAAADPRLTTWRRGGASWPEELVVDGGGDRDRLGTIADLQCGGWSTTLLTARGALFTVGVIDGAQPDHRPATRPRPLTYPLGFPHPKDRYDPATAVRQFSAGRAHVLGLADSGRVWSWWSWEHAAVHVKLLQHDIREDGRIGARGAVKKVVAGWNKSAVLIEGVGIVLWDPLRLESTDIGLSDAVLVLETQVVPQTGYSAARVGARETTRRHDAARLGEKVGEVTNFVVLEDVVLFSTTLGKVFAAHVTWTSREHRIAHPIELPLSMLRADEQAPHPDSTFATDVQGSFRSFAVFVRSGAVLTSDQDALLPFLMAEGRTGARGAPRLFKQIPALQHRNVISIAFGDYHFHALHASGHITSYGTEPQGCGAFGLGGHGTPEGRLRGIRYLRTGGDGHLVPHAYTEGRRVWFEREKRYWIQYLTSGGVDPGEAAERMRMAIGRPGIEPQGELSEWIEQEGRDWESKLGVDGEDSNADGLGAYFALSVAAAGWHSGALVLVNEGLAGKLSAACEVEDPHAATDSTSELRHEKTTRFYGLNWLLDTAIDYGLWFLGVTPYGAGYDAAHHRQPHSYGASPRSGFSFVWAKHHFPRLRLSDGTEMPGKVNLDEWRYGRPTWNFHWDRKEDSTPES